MRTQNQTPITEKQWQEQVIDLARMFGWRIAHFRPAQTSKGWRTAVAADGQGYPDLTLARDRIIFLELKTDTGKLSAAQTAWLNHLAAAGAETYVARPQHLELLAAILTWRAGQPDISTTPLTEYRRIT
jgi:hypothetical protein